MFACARMLAMRKSSRCGKTTVFPRFFLCARHIARVAHRPKNDEKSLLEPFEWTFSRRTCQNLVLGAPRLDFVRVWGPPRHLLDGSWAFLGVSWTLLGASWALLRHLLDALGCLLAAKCCPRGAWARFWRLLGASGEGFGGPKAVFFMGFSYISLYNAFNSAVTTLLHFPTLFLLTFWCGGLCTAHGITRSDRPSMRIVPLLASFWASCWLIFCFLRLPEPLLASCLASLRLF